jgi:hypothetical protein
MGSFSIIVFQWYFWGYSLAFSNTGTSGFIGDLQHFGLMNTLGMPSPGSPLIPELLYSFYQVWLYANKYHHVRYLINDSFNSVPPQPLLWSVLLLSEAD